MGLFGLDAIYRAFYYFSSSDKDHLLMKFLYVSYYCWVNFVWVSFNWFYFSSGNLLIFSSNVPSPGNYSSNASGINFEFSLNSIFDRFNFNRDSSIVLSVSNVIGFVFILSLIFPAPFSIPPATADFATPLIISNTPSIIVFF